MNQAIISSFKTVQKEIPSLYILKALCAFAIILIHTTFFHKELFTPLYRLAVPLFFMISGYFMVSINGEVSIDKIWKSLKKIFWINLIATCIYLSYSLLGSTLKYFITGTTNYYNILIPKHFWEGLLLTNPYAGHLWYLVAYMQVLLIILLFIYKNKFFLLLKLFPLFFALGLFMGIYNSWHPFNYLSYHRNFLTMGLPFVLLGSWIKVYQKQCLSFFNKAPYLILALCLICTYSEYYFLKQLEILGRGDYWLSTIFLSFAVFCYFIRSPYLGKNKTITDKLITIGRDFSLFLYLYHILIQNIIRLVTYKLGASISDIEYLIVLFLTLFVSITIKSFKKYYHKIYA